MAHEYKKEAEASHAKKLKSYGAPASSTVDKANKDGDATNFAGFRALNTDKQAGMAPLSGKGSMSKETMSRIMRKKGGKVVGATSLKRLDKAPRKGKAAGGQMMGTGQRVGPIPSADEQQYRYDPTTRVNPGEMSPGTMRKKGGKVMGRQQDYEDRSHESQGAEGLRGREAHKKGGSAFHEGHMSKGEKYGAARTSGETKGELDSAMRALKYGNKAKAEKELGRAQGHTRKTEYYTGRAKGGEAFEGSARDEREDKKLEKKYGMTHKEWEASDLDKKHDRQESMKGLKKGGRAKKEMGGTADNAEAGYSKGGRAHRATGGGAFDDYSGGDSSAPKAARSPKGKTTVNIMIGQPGQQQDGMNPMALAALAAASRGGPGAGAPPPPPPQGMPPQGAPPMGATPPVMPQGGTPPVPPQGATPPQMPRARGGRAGDVQVPYRKPGRTADGYPAMDFGAGGGFGRKAKIDAYGTKGPGSNS